MNEREPTDRSVTLSPAEWHALLEDIGRVGLMLGRERDSLLAAHPSHEQPHAATPLERLRLLETLWPPMEQALRALAACLDSRVQIVSIAVPVTRSRGGSRAAAEIACRPQSLSAWLAARKQERAPDRTAQVTEARPLVSADTSANRLLITELTDLEREANALATLAEICGEPNEAGLARTLAGTLRRWRAHSAFKSITLLTEEERAAVSISETLLRCPPPYRRFFSLIRSLRSPLCLDWSDAALLRLPQRAPWQLYEIWCFLRVAACLRTAGWRPVEGDCFRIAPNGLRLALATGRASRLRFVREGVSLELYYQPLFQSANQADLTPGLSPVSRFVSRTHAMQPDIALLHKGTLYLLDAKFRAYAKPTERNAFGHAEDALLEDVDKMHAYRDSIVGVAQAWCLFPGSSHEARKIVAYPQSSAAQPFGTAGIGAIRLRPGGDTLALERLIRGWVEPASYSFSEGKGMRQEKGR